MSTSPTDDFQEEASPRSFAETLERLRAVIEGAGMTIFAQIDHAAAAVEVGLHMPPATVLIYGNPKGGTPIMRAAPRAALDLPLKILIRADENGSTFVGFHPIDTVLKNAGVDPEAAKKLRHAQAIVFEGAMQ